MPVEIRRVVFTQDEIVKLIQDAIGDQDDDFAGAKLLYMEKLSDDPINFVGAFRRRNGSQTMRHINQTFLTFVMVDYCLGQKIPMARQAEKTARLLDLKKFALDIEIEAKRL